MLNLRTLALLTAFGTLAIGLGASSTQSRFNTRWSRATSDIAQTQPNISQEKLRARAVQILRERTVAKDEATNDAALREKACASFNQSSLNVTCE